jgi:16S rRNA (cytosine1402-N4)-methyltransferase
MDEEKKTPASPAHRRRAHYSGKYPRHFAEKYKELNPEKYADEQEKVTEKGRTPAGTHIPIMVDEILDILRIEPGKIGLDATLGYGGHTEKMLEKLAGRGHLYATDLDPIESAKTRDRLASLGYGPEILTVLHQNYAELDRVSPDRPFDFILADLGVSSMQIDNPARGFTWKAEGPLDLRLDPTAGETAAERLRSLDREEIEGLLRENADEPLAAEIAEEISSIFRKGGEIRTTTDLRKAVEAALPPLPAAEKREALRKSCQRVFQALRIDVNSEFESLYTFLEKLPAVLAPGGRVAVLTFHSGEDRLVKKAFRQGEKDGIYRAAAKEPIRPGREECWRNPRAHSTKLRWAVRAGKDE